MKLTFQYVPSPDLSAAVAFYGEVLGLDEAWREDDGTVAFWAPDRSVQLMVATTDQPAGPMYLVDDAAAWAAAHAGVPVRVPSYPIPGGTVAGFADPNGNVFYVFDQRQRR